MRAEAGASTRVDRFRPGRALKPPGVTAGSGNQTGAAEIPSAIATRSAGRREENIRAGLLLPLIERQSARIDLNRNPTILVACADAAVARAELRNYKAQRYPTLSLEANTNKYIGDIADYQRHSQYQNVYLSVNSTLYQGGALVAQESASARALEAARPLLPVRNWRLAISSEIISRALKDCKKYHFAEQPDENHYGNARSVPGTIFIFR